MTISELLRQISALNALHAQERRPGNAAIEINWDDNGEPGHVWVKHNQKYRLTLGAEGSK